MQSPITQLKHPAEKNSIEYHWCKWIFDNLLNGCTPQSMENTLRSGTAQNKAELIAEVYREANDPYLQAEKK